MKAPGIEQADVATASDLLHREVTIVRPLAGGVHAVTVVISDGRSEYVLRRFPADDPAVTYEVEVLQRLGPMGDGVPRLLAYSTEQPAPMIITTKVPGAPPGTALSLTQVATGMAGALARIHNLDGTGLRANIGGPPTGHSDIAAHARSDWPHLDHSKPVLTHYDYWCGNTLWKDNQLTGVVDWSGARHAPRGIDLAWCRLDLVLMGDPSAADTLLSAYELHQGDQVQDIDAWDRHAAAKAYPVVESWSPNYTGIGRNHLTPHTLRQRLNAWVDRLLDAD